MNKPFPLTQDTIHQITNMSRYMYENHNVLNLADLDYETFFLLHFNISTYRFAGKPMEQKLLAFHDAYLNELAVITSNDLFLPQNIRSLIYRINVHFRHARVMTPEFVALLTSAEKMKMGLIVSDDDIKHVDWKALKIAPRFWKSNTRMETVTKWYIAGDVIARASPVSNAADFGLKGIDAWRTGDIEQFIKKHPHLTLTPTTALGAYQWYAYSSLPGNVNASSASWLSTVLSQLKTLNIPFRTAFDRDESAYTHQAILTIKKDGRITRREGVISITPQLHKEVMALKPKAFPIVVENDSFSTPLTIEPLDQRPGLRDSIIRNISLAFTPLTPSKMDFGQVSNLKCIILDRVATTKTYSNMAFDHMQQQNTDEMSKMVVIANKAEGKSTLINAIREVNGPLTVFTEDSDDFGEFLTFVMKRKELTSIFDGDALEPDEVISLVDEFYTDKLSTNPTSYTSHLQIAAYHILDEVITSPKDPILNPEVQLLKWMSHYQEHLDVLHQVFNAYIVKLEAMTTLNQKTFEDGIYKFIASKMPTCKTYIAFFHVTLDNSTRRPADVMVRLLNAWTPTTAIIWRAKSKNSSPMETLTDVFLQSFFLKTTDYTTRAIDLHQVLVMAGKRASLDVDASLVFTPTS